MPRVRGIEQNTPAWIKIRRGMVTASRVMDLVKKLKTGGEAATRRHYRMEKLGELLAQYPYAANHWVSAEMQWGIDHQLYACSAYEAETDTFTEPGGFWVHDRIRRFGASPDYLVGDGLVEVKCPSTDTHLEYLDSKEVPEPYLWQMQSQMACTGAKWCDFVSYDPRLKTSLQLWIKHVPRDDKLIHAIETEVEQFWSEIDQTISKLNGEKHESKNPECVSA